VDGIEKLPPGDWLEWIDGEVSSGSYWRLPFGVSSDYTLESAKEEMDSLLQDAVREHLLSDVPLGVWLSGGIDSSTILHYAAKASSSQLKTFSISFRGRSFDETEYVHRAAKQYGTDHQELDSRLKRISAERSRNLHTFRRTQRRCGALPVGFRSMLSKTKTSVALSGEGADELFGGYLTYRANRLAARARLLPRTISQLALAGFQYWPVSDEKISFEYKVKRFLEGSLMSPGRAHVYWNGTFSDAEKRALLNQKLPNSLGRVLAEVDELPSTPDDLAPYLWFDQKYYLADDILTKSDRMSMAHSVEVRPPFLDHRIVEFAAKLPASLKIRGTQQKFVLKELMKDKLPREILQRKKIGFDIPEHEWLRGPLRSLLTDALHYGATECGELLRTDVIDTYLRLPLEAQAKVGYHLWGLLILFLWMKNGEFKQRPPRRRRLYYTRELARLPDRSGRRRSHLPGMHRFSAVVDGRWDAVQAQIARNMLTSGDWVTARLDGVAYLESTARLLDYRHFLQDLWRPRLGRAHPHRTFRDGARLAYGRVWQLGFRKTRRPLRGIVHGYLHRNLSVYKDSDSRRDADIYNCAGDVGVSPHP
jgi:asparagine synthase (glutamine-hydrolysing)